MEVKGYNIYMTFEVAGEAKIIAGVTSHDFALAYDVQMVRTKKDAGIKRFITTGYELRFNVAGLVTVNEQGAATIDRAGILDLVLLAQPIKFVYVLGTDIISGSMIVTDYAENSAASGLATYNVRCVLTGALTRGGIPDNAILDTYGQPILDTYGEFITAQN